MYRLFVYGYDYESKHIHIIDEYEYNTLEDALKRAVFFDDDDLFEIAKDVPLIDERVDLTCLKTIARPASMSAFFNSYCSRW